MKIRIISSFVLGTLLLACSSEPTVSEPTLKEAFNGKFYIGAALNTNQAAEIDTSAVNLVKTHFNSIVAENCMKSEQIQPEEGVFNFEDADRFVEFGEENNMHIVGHCLIWHSQAPKWFFIDNEGNDVSREVMIDRMKTHVTTLVSRYKGRVDGWDVVNEAFNEDGTLRNSKFLQIVGEDYLELAFKFAHEADPDAELYYNDYNMYKAEKAGGATKLVKRLQEKGLRIDAVGLQAHIGLDDLHISEYEKSILNFADLGVKVMFTELDMTVIPWPGVNTSAEVSTSFEFQEKYNPYPNALPDSINIAQADAFKGLFVLFLKYSDVVDRVTMWGVNDGNTWRNNWPVVGRKDYPLLFDRNYEPKLAVQQIIDLTKTN